MRCLPSTIPHEKQGKYLVSPQTLCEDGQIKDSSHISKHQEEHDFMNLEASSNSEEVSEETPILNKESLKVFAIAESHQQDKKTICSDKLITCVKDSQITESSQTLGVESISKGRDSRLFWSLQARDTSKRLWLPTEIGCADLHLNSLSGFFTTMESNSWFSIKTWNPQRNQSLQKICFPSSKCSIAESTDVESTKAAKNKKKPTTFKKSKKVSPNVTHKVGLRLTPEQRDVLKRWFGCYRSTYNWALGCIKNKPAEYRKTDHIWLRKRFVNKVNIPKSMGYLLDCPKAVRDNALAELTTAYKTNFAKMRKNPAHKFDLSFKSKKDDQCMTIEKEQFKSYDLGEGTFKIFPTFITNRISFHAKRNKLPENIDYACKIVLNRLGRFSMAISFYVPPDASAGENQVSSRSQDVEVDGMTDWCAIDPGVRTLYTVYCPKPGCAYKLADKDISRVYRLSVHLDNLMSSISKENSKRRKYRKHKASHRLRARIRNIVTEVHCKVVQFLVTRFRHIVVPPFEVSNMISRGGRKITRKTVRQMVSWRHYALRMRLLQAAARHGCKVYIRGEEYTTKACTQCLHIKHNIGGAKVYRCSECNLTIDRDLNGARNIFLKNMTLKSCEHSVRRSSGAEEESDFASLEP